MKLQQTLITIFQGLWIGGTMTVPGVSGGSMAMILGIYDKLIFSINSFLKRPKENIVFLLKVAVGAGIGIILFSRVILLLLSQYSFPTRYFFIGAVVGGLPMILREAKVKRLSLPVILYPLAGILLVLLIAMLPSGLFTANLNQGIGAILLQILAGVIVAVALVLPGISGSQMLLMLGLYEQVIQAVSSFDLVALIPFGIGGVAGTLLSARLIEKAIRSYPQATYLFILGFIIGSVAETYPGIPLGGDLPVSLLTAVAGFLSVYGMAKLEDRTGAHR